MLKRFLWMILVAGVLSPSMGCHCVRQLLCCDSMMYGGCGACGGAGCASCDLGCDSCGGVGCASCTGGCDSCGGVGCGMCGGRLGQCFPLLGGVVNWIFHPCAGCEGLYSTGHSSGCGCESCASGGPIDAPYNVTPYMDGGYQEEIMTPTPAPPESVGSAQYTPNRNPVSSASYQARPVSTARAGSTYTGGGRVRR